MTNLDELTQISYEISMAIGSSLNLRRMCREVGLVALRKLNSTAFVVFEDVFDDSGNHHFERVFITPKNFLTTDHYFSLERVIEPTRDERSMAEFHLQMPLTVSEDPSGVWHLMSLPGFGLLAIFRGKGPFPKEVIQSFTPLNRKLAVACNACVAHQTLDASEKKHKLLLEAMKEGVGIINREGMLSYANKGLADLLAVDVKDLRTESVMQFFDATNRHIIEGSLHASCGGTITSCELTWQKHDGSAIQSLTSFRLMEDSDPGIKQCLMVVTDMTSQIQSEKRLSQIQKMEAIGTLAGGIAHDFNNMLAVIIGNTSLLSVKNSDDALTPLLSDIEKAANQAKSLTHQLLTFSKGGAPMTKTEDINDLLKNSAEFVLRGSKAACAFDLATDLPPVEIDAAQIGQVISNLLINANQAMPEGGVVTIRTESAELAINNRESLPPGSYIKVTLADQGTGIPKTVIDRIFDPFFTTKEDGNGLGLATAYSIIRKHNGTITVESQPDSGTSFHMFLPASSKPLEPDVKEQERDHSGSGRILLLDDNEMMLKVLQMMLGQMGYDTVLTRDGKEAVVAYQKSVDQASPFSLVMLDLTISGGMGGLATLAEIKKINPDVKAVVSSGYSNDPVMARYKDYGFSGIISKPFRMAELATLLENLL